MRVCRRLGFLCLWRACGVPVACPWRALGVPGRYYLSWSPGNVEPDLMVKKFTEPAYPTLAASFFDEVVEPILATG